MDLPEFIHNLEGDLKEIVSPEFETRIEKIERVPSLKRILKSEEGEGPHSFSARRIRTCVLYMDIRRSIVPGFKKEAQHKTKVYFAFLRIIVRAAEYYGGKVCNVAGDRVMVLFDTHKCFTRAVNTAFLLNTIAKDLLEPNFPHRTIRCGIGIDYGRIFVSKVQVSGWREGDENFNALVWLGKPTNRASKLTEAANRSLKSGEGLARLGRYYHAFREWSWRVVDEYANLFTMLGPKPMSVVTGPECQLKKAPAGDSPRVEPILVTGRVYRGLKEEHPDDVSLKRLWWRKKSIQVPNYTGDIFGIDVMFDCY
ncbi:MAG: hypothetical protein MAG453_00830 [Calditrichaeota bacterium]|nr:hypothetical protein [Calditrichota bacterium]